MSRSWRREFEWIDPYRCWQWRDGRRDVFESFGGSRKRIVEDALALCEDLISKVVVDRVLINAKPSRGLRHRMLINAKPARSGAKLSS
jgi:hypothetical protein